MGFYSWLFTYFFLTPRFVFSLVTALLSLVEA